MKLLAASICMPDCTESRTLSNSWGCDTRFITTPHRELTWIKPEEGTVAINTDGSKSDADAGFGAIIRDHQGAPMEAVAGSSTPSSITLHEMQGVDAGLKLAVLKNHSRVSLRSDSMTVVSYLQSSNPKPPWHCHHVWESIKRHKAILAEVSCSHSHRETNRAADEVASLKPPGSFIIIDPSNFNEKLKKIIEEDASGKIYIRV